MNIKLHKKNAIKSLYKRGVSIEDLEAVSGLSKKTILEIVSPKNNFSALFEEITEVWQEIRLID